MPAFGEQMQVELAQPQAERVGGFGFLRAAGPDGATTARMLYIYDRIDSFRQRGIGTVVRSLA